MANHTVVHFEIPADDVEKLSKFYSELFGWKIVKMPGPIEYCGIQTVPADNQGMLLRNGVNGGMMKRQNPEHKPVNYIAVESVDEIARKLKNWVAGLLYPRWRFLV
jgi:predicted enzyme related to lactoylglutathione lyase